MNGTEKTSRNLLLALGVPDFQATLVIPTLYHSPGVTDPNMAGVSVVVSRIQDVLNTAGYNLPLSGQVDAPTSAALVQICGPYYLNMTWADVIAAVLDYVKNGSAYAASDNARAAAQSPDVTLSDVPTIGSLSSNASLAVYAGVGILAYLWWSKRKKGARTTAVPHPEVAP
jgi:hypothetical protein